MYQKPQLQEFGKFRELTQNHWNRRDHRGPRHDHGDHFGCRYEDNDGPSAS